MSQISNNPRGSEPSEPYQLIDSALPEHPNQAPVFTTLPLEMRLQIYGYILSPTKHTLRRQEDYGLHTETKPFDTSLLSVNKQINAETVPILYANHTFHYGVSCHPRIPSHNLEWLNHASIHITARDGRLADTMLATQIQELDTCCPVLRTLTVHIIRIGVDETSESVMQQLLSDGLTAKALRTLRPRLDRLSIVTRGVSTCLEVFRQSIATDGSPWVEEILDTWPLISLNRAPSVLPPVVPAPQPRSLLTHASLQAWVARLQARIAQSIHATHLFGQNIAQKLQEGKIEKKDWFFAK